MATVQSRPSPPWQSLFSVFFLYSSITMRLTHLCSTCPMLNRASVCQHLIVIHFVSAAVTWWRCDGVPGVSVRSAVGGDARWGNQEPHQGLCQHLHCLRWSWHPRTPLCLQRGSGGGVGKQQWPILLTWHSTGTLTSTNRAVTTPLPILELHLVVNLLRKTLPYMYCPIVKLVV